MYFEISTAMTKYILLLNNRSTESCNVKCFTMYKNVLETVRDLDFLVLSLSPPSRLDSDQQCLSFNFLTLTEPQQKCWWKKFKSIPLNSLPASSHLWLMNSRTPYWLFPLHLTSTAFNNIQFDVVSDLNLWETTHSCLLFTPFMLLLIAQLCPALSSPG